MVAQEGWWLLGVTGLTGSSSGKEPGDRGTSLAVPQLGHQEPFLGDTAARREDPDFQGHCLCLPCSFRKPLFDIKADIYLSFSASSGQT